MIFSSLSPWNLGLGTWKFHHPSWWAHVNTSSLLSTFQTKCGTSRHRDVDDPGPSQMSVPMAGFGLVDTIGNRANGRRPRLPPLQIPLLFFLPTHPSRNIPVNPVACHGSFEFSHCKPPKKCSRRTLSRLLLARWSFVRDRDCRPEH